MRYSELIQLLDNLHINEVYSISIEYENSDNVDKILELKDIF